MIFSGDLVFPYSSVNNVIKDIEHPFWKMPKIVNLESSINLRKHAKLTEGIALSSDKEVIFFFEKLNVQCVSMANNHVLDFAVSAGEQIAYLEEHGVEVIGFGETLDKAANCYYSEVADMVVVSFGWDVIRCKYATLTAAGVNPYEYKWVERLVTSLRKKFPHSQLVTIFHWNYEFEKYPQPADREFAHFLIKIGVDAVIGHHAHIIQGFEFVSGKPIFYGLGNFYFPNGNYDGFSLKFAEAANKGLSVHISKLGPYAYITELVDNFSLKVIDEGKPDDIVILNDLSSFRGMSHREYIDFFKKHRVKKKLLPIYRSYKHEVRNYLYDCFVKGRQIPVDLLSKARGGSR